MRKLANLELTMGPVLGHDGDQYDDVDQADDDHCGQYNVGDDGGDDPGAVFNCN